MITVRFCKRLYLMILRLLFEGGINHESRQGHIQDQNLSSVPICHPERPFREGSYEARK